MSLTSQKARSLGRLELLAWLNRFIGADYARVEDLRDGIAFVQVFAALYPKKNYLSRLVDDPRAPKDFERNFKALDAIIRSRGVKNRPIDADSLAKGSFKALHELLQWLHWHVEAQAPEISQDPKKIRQREEISVNGVSDFGDHSATIVQASSPLDTAADAAHARFDKRFAGDADAMYNSSSGGRSGKTFQRGGEAMSWPPPAPDMQVERIKAYRRLAQKQQTGPAQEKDTSSSVIDEARYLYREIEVIIPALELDLTRELREQTALMATLQEICKERDALFDTLRAVERACELLPVVGESMITNQTLEILHSNPLSSGEAAENQNTAETTKKLSLPARQVVLRSEADEPASPSPSITPPSMVDLKVSSSSSRPSSLSSLKSGERWKERVRTVKILDSAKTSPTSTAGAGAGAAAAAAGAPASDAGTAMGTAKGQYREGSGP